MRLRKKARILRVEFCDGCGSVCDAACLAERTRERHQVWALAQVPPPPR